MIVYHGTTRSRAQLIRKQGFSPRRPSRRVWFARKREYARHRTRTQAKRAQDSPVVLRCDIDMNTLSAWLGRGRVVDRNDIIAVRGRVPASVLSDDKRSLTEFPPELEIPNTASGLASWLNRILGVKPHKGVSQRHPGIDRLLTWIRKRLAARPRSVIREQELLAVARQWLPEFFEGVEVDFEHLRTLPAHGRAATDRILSAEEYADDDEGDVDSGEEEILDCVMSDKARRRVRGLKLLAERGAADLFDWGMMFLGDEDVSVQVAALETMCASPDVNPALIADLAGDEDRRVRAAALEVLAVHEADEGEEGDGRLKWLWAGVTDPDTHVRLAMVKHLRKLWPEQHREIFETLLYDPSPEIARTARRLTVGKGFGKPSW